MNNLQRIEMETKGIKLSQQELIVYLKENGLEPHTEYLASPESQKSIYATSLSILESLANNPENFQNIKMDDMTVSQFSENISRRISHLTQKVRSMQTTSRTSDTFMLFN